MHIDPEEIFLSENEGKDFGNGEKTIS